jgi:hypothetical protein
MPIKVGITKEEAQRRLGNVPGEYVFFCKDGRVLRNLGELRDVLGTMSDDLFSYHVNKDKNDFMNWVRDVVKDEALAKQLSKVNRPRKAADVVKKEINFLGKKV